MRYSLIKKLFTFHKHKILVHSIIMKLKKLFTLHKHKTLKVGTDIYRFIYNTAEDEIA